MGKINQKKLAMFRLFSQNMEWVKACPGLSFDPDFSNGYVCPLCFEVFFEKDLDPDCANPLTLEDIPPSSLGGKPLALTCKKCNSTSGHLLDAHLLRSLLETDAKLFLPHSSSEVSFTYEGNRINGAFSVDEKGKVRLDLASQRSHPQQAKEFKKHIFPDQTKLSPLFYPYDWWKEQQSPRFDIQFKISSNERRAEIALLRIAYLIAFATLGNGFLINGGLYKVREQIANPDREILPKAFWIKKTFDKKCEGINIIALPRELQCYLVVFSLRTKSQERQFAIALPGRTMPGIGVYDFITEKLCRGDGSESTQAIIEHLGRRDYLRDKKNVFAALAFWNQCTGPDYKPRIPTV